MGSPSTGGTAIKRLRERRGFTIRGLAEASGVHFTTIHGLESGHQQATSAEKLARIAKALGVTSEALLVRLRRTG